MSDTPETDKIAHAGLPERAYISEMTHKSRKLERERDEARTERERAEAKCSAEYEAHKMTQAERDALRAEVEQLKAENGTLRNAQMCCEFCDETVTVETLRELRADKARLDWIKALDCDSPFWGVLCDTTKLRAAIDAAMKGEL